MDDKQVLAAACRQLGVDADCILSHRSYDDRIVLVVNRGIAGCPKYEVLLADLPRPKPKRRSTKTKRTKGGGR